MSSDQAREEHAYAVGVQTAIWGQPLVDNVHTLYAGFKAGAVGLNYLRKADLFGAHEVNRDVAPIAKKGPVSLELEHIPSY